MRGSTHFPIMFIFLLSFGALVYPPESRIFWAVQPDRIQSCNLAGHNPSDVVIGSDNPIRVAMDTSGPAFSLNGIDHH